MNDKYTRREALEIGLGTAVMGISGAAVMAAQTAGKPAATEGNVAPSLSTFRKYGEDMETAMLLRALGAHDGINLDGGGSSSLALRYPDGKVRVANTPVHGGVPGRERAVAGCIGVYTINPSTER